MSNQTIDNILSQIKLCSKILYKLNLRQVSGDLDYFIDWFNSKYWKHYGHDLHLGPHPAGNNTIDAYSHNCPIPYLRLLKYVTNNQIRSMAVALLTDAYDQFNLLKDLISNDNEIVAVSSFINYLHDVIVYNGGDPGPGPGPDPEIDELTLEFYLKTNNNIPQEIHFNANDHWYSIIESQEDANKLTAFGHDINTTGGYLGYDFDYQYGCLSYQPDKFKYEVVDILDVNGNHVEDAGNVNDNLYTAFNTSHNILSIYSKDIPIYSLCYAWKIKITKKEITPDLTDYTRKPVTFKMISPGSICCERHGGLGNFNVEYSINDGDWTTYTVKNPGTDISLNIGDEISWRCPYGNHPSNKSYDNYVGFKTSADVVLCGNVASTRMEREYESPWRDNRIYSNIRFAFNRLFTDCKGYIDASNLYIPMPGPDEYYSSCESYCADMFNECSGLVKAPDLSHLKITGLYSHAAMFRLCINLIYPPAILPSTVPTSQCYNAMFAGCKALCKSPKIMLKTMDGSSVFQFMFADCASLKEVWCNTKYLSGNSRTENWLYNVASEGTIYFTDSTDWPLNSVNGVPTGWKIVDPNCLCLTNIDNNLSTVALNVIGSVTTDYEVSNDGINWTSYIMGTSISLMNQGDKVYFRGSKGSTDFNNYINFSMTGLISASGNVNSLLQKTGYTTIDVPAYAYVCLFDGCTSLVTSPEFPSINLGRNCYWLTFKDCTKLTKPSKLPALNLSTECYGGMFWGSGITEMPELPATTLAEGCYQWMFYGCTSLTKIQNLPATNLQTNCYHNMFENCTSITKVDNLPAIQLAQSSYQNMFAGCSNLSEIHCAAVNNNYYRCTQDWLSGVANTGTAYVSNDAIWQLNSASGIPTGWKIVDTKCLCLTNVNDDVSTVALNKIGNFTTDYEVSNDGISWDSYTMGTVISLPNAGDKVYFRGNKSVGEFSTNYIQFSMTGLISASGNVNSLLQKTGYNTTSIQNYAYAHLFEDCACLVSAPEFPSISLGWNCYAETFKNCTSLTIPPKLPATSLSGYCYGGMFWGSGLTEMPELPSTSLSDGCYQWMFGNCTSLTKTVNLPATSLRTNCYKHMFENCSNLNEVNCSATSISATDCTLNWLSNVANTGTFYKNTSSWSSGVSGIPYGWLHRSLTESYLVHIADTGLPTVLDID